MLHFSLSLSLSLSGAILSTSNHNYEDYTKYDIYCILSIWIYMVLYLFTIEIIILPNKVVSVL